MKNAVMPALLLTSTLSAAVMWGGHSPGDWGRTTVTILHTNDIHGAFLPHQAMWARRRPAPWIGGFVRLASAVDSLRAEHGTTLLLDAGDVMTGNPVCELDYDGALGGALFAMMNTIGYDGWCPGNHELDISQENLRGLGRIALFPMLSANLVDTAGRLPLGNRSFTVMNRGGIRVGVIGLMSQDLAGLVLQKNISGLLIHSPAETLQKWIDSLDSSTDLLVALTHQGFEEDSVLATSVRGLDVIVGGHSHTRLHTPREVNGVIIVQAGTATEYLGYLKLEVADDRVVRHEGALLPLWDIPQARTSRLAVMVDSLSAVIDSTFSEVLATLETDWVRSDSACGMGRFITEAQRKAAGAQVGFMNVHGIRKDVPAGPLTRKDMLEILPFRNLLATFQLTGSELRRVLQFHLEMKSRIICTGLSVEWRQRGGSPEICSVEIGGVPLEEHRLYVCSANEYLVGHASVLLGLSIDRPVYLRTTMREAVEQGAKEAGRIQADGRSAFRRVP